MSSTFIKFQDFLVNTIPYVDISHCPSGAAAMLFVTISILVSLFVLRARPAHYPPGPFRLPFIGNLHQLGTHPFIKFMSMGKKYGDIFAIDFASFRGIVLNNPKLIREALAMPEFSGRPKLRPFLERTGDGQFRGLVSNEGPHQIQLRRFVHRQLRDLGMGKKSMESVIQDEVQELMSVLAQHGGKPIETRYLFNLAMVNSLWWIVAGERFSYDDERLKEIVKIMTDGLADTATTGVALFFPWLSRLAPKLTGYNKFMDFQFDALKLIRQTYHAQKETFESGSQPRHFLDVFHQEIVNTQDPTSAFYGEAGEKNLISSVTDLFLAGTETTSTTMTWIVLLLATHQQVQERMFNEIKVVTDDGSRLPSLDDQQNLPYVQAVLTEVLRYSSIIPLNVFHSTTQDVMFHGYKIPKETMIMPNLYAVHHDPIIWGDPGVFRPERFLISDEQHRGAGYRFSKPMDNVLPFSIGKRVCIGEAFARNTLLLFMTSMFQRFHIFPNPDQPKPVVDWVLGHFPENSFARQTFAGFYFPDCDICRTVQLPESVSSNYSKNHIFILFRNQTSKTSSFKQIYLKIFKI